MTDFTDDDFKNLFLLYRDYNDKVNDEKVLIDLILQRVYLLMCKDVQLISLDNSKGDLCTTYPTKIFVPIELVDSEFKNFKNTKINSKETIKEEKKLEKISDVAKKLEDEFVILDKPESSNTKPQLQEEDIILENEKFHEEIVIPKIVKMTTSDEEEENGEKEKADERLEKLKKKDVSRSLFVVEEDEEGFKQPTPKSTKKKRSVSQQREEKEEKKEYLKIKNFNSESSESVTVKGNRGSVFKITPFKVPTTTTNCKSRSQPTTPRDFTNEEGVHFEENYFDHEKPPSTPPLKERISNHYRQSMTPSTPTTPIIDTQDLIAENVLKSKEFEEVIMECRFCRTHGRFAVPVVFYGKKYISRSGTISRGAESIFRSIGTSFMNYFTDNSNKKSSILQQKHLRQWDTELLERINAKHIIDLMVEKRKVKYGVVVCSSEKSEKSGLYQKFMLEVMPYPGRESFVFKGKSQKKQYQFRWSDSGTCDAEFQTTIDMKLFPNINLQKFRDWNLIQITQNYLILMLEMLGKGEDDEGLLIHCVSGWDRTPLFVSLIRIILWSDGEIHKELNINQFLYLTVSYDWMLFFHNFQERMEKSEEIFKFCFEFLQYIDTEEYSILKYKSFETIEMKELLLKEKKKKLKGLYEKFNVFYKMTEK
eukprot:gene8698-645_t